VTDRHSATLGVLRTLFRTNKTRQKYFAEQATVNKRKYKPAANPSNILFFLKTG
jgi:hypothetical protein